MDPKSPKWPGKAQNTNLGYEGRRAQILVASEPARRVDHVAYIDF